MWSTGLGLNILDPYQNLSMAPGLGRCGSDFIIVPQHTSKTEIEQTMRINAFTADGEDKWWRDTIMKGFGQQLALTLLIAKSYQPCTWSLVLLLLLLLFDFLDPHACVLLFQQNLQIKVISNHSGSSKIYSCIPYFFLVLWQTISFFHCNAIDEHMSGMNIIKELRSTKPSSFLIARFNSTNKSII